MQLSVMPVSIRTCAWLLRTSQIIPLTIRSSGMMQQNSWVVEDHNTCKAHLSRFLSAFFFSSKKHVLAQQVHPLQYGSRMDTNVSSGLEAFSSFIMMHMFCELVKWCGYANLLFCQVYFQKVYQEEHYWTLNISPPHLKLHHM